MSDQFRKSVDHRVKLPDLLLPSIFLFSRILRGYIVSRRLPTPDPEPTPDPDHRNIDSGKDPSNGGETNTGTKESAEGKAIPAETGDASGMALWLALMFLTAGAALTALSLKKTGRTS